MQLKLKVFPRFDFHAVNFCHKMLQLGFFLREESMLRVFFFLRRYRTIMFTLWLFVPLLHLHFRFFSFKSGGGVLIYMPRLY